MSSQPSASHTVIPTERKRAEGSPRENAEAVAPLIRHAAKPRDTFSPRRRQGGAVPFRASAMPWKGLRPLPSYVIPTERPPMSSRTSVSHTVIPTERSERRDPKGRMRFPWGISHFVRNDSMVAAKPPLPCCPLLAPKAIKGGNVEAVRRDKGGCVK